MVGLAKALGNFSLDPSVNHIKITKKNKCSRANEQFIVICPQDQDEDVMSALIPRPDLGQNCVMREKEKKLIQNS